MYTTLLFVMHAPLFYLSVIQMNHTINSIRNNRTNTAYYILSIAVNMYLHKFEYLTRFLIMGTSELGDIFL